MKKNKILLIYKWVSMYPWKMPTPIQKDLELLKQDFRVTTFSFCYKKLPSLIREINQSDLIFVWFGGDHAFVTALITRFIKRPIVIVLGGYEVAHEKEIKYGYMLNPYFRKMVKYTLNKADKVLTVDESLKNDAINYLDIEGKNIQTLPTGYNVEKFKPNGKKENLVMTVALCPDWNRVRLKGIDTFVEAARQLPYINFLIIGIQDEAMDRLKEIIPKNVKLLPPIYQEKLINYYQKAKVYCQLSMREGFPNTVCEAMCCECIPIGTKILGIKTAIGDTGFYVDFGNVNETIQTIKKTMQLSDDFGKKARERIKNNFSSIHRKDKLKEIFLKLLK